MDSKIATIEEEATHSYAYRNASECDDRINTNFVGDGSGKEWIVKALKIHKQIEFRAEKRQACSDKIFFATRNRLYEGQLKNFSRNGLFIKTKEVLPIGEIITVVDPNPAEVMQKRRGQILWRNHEGFGVELFQRHCKTNPSVIRFKV
jgi:hypothetical protein